MRRRFIWRRVGMATQSLPLLLRAGIGFLAVDGRAMFGLLLRVGWMAGACRFGSCSRLLARQRLALKPLPLIVVFLALQVAKPPLDFRAAI